jgi:hypothetical protein
MERRNVITVVSLLLGSFVAEGQEAAPPAAGPETGDAEKALKQQVEEQQGEIQELKEKVGQLLSQVTELENAIPSWLEAVTLKGDIRYRYDYIKRESAKPRHRNRVRLRVGLIAEINEHIDLGLRIASGSDDPVSTNQSLDGGFSTKDIRLDRAYLDFHPTFVPHLTLQGGKIPNPFYKPGKAELFWDSDLNPEGGALSYTIRAQTITLFTTLAGFWVEERSSDVDSGLFGAQGGFKSTVSEDYEVYLLGGASFFNYTHTTGNTTFFDDEDGYGNTTVTDAGGKERYVYDYGIVEFFAEAGATVANIPFSIFGDVGMNTATGTSEKSAWLAGCRIGNAKKPGSWAFRYNYRKVEADSMIGIFTDSDFREGGTDAQGHEIGVDYIVLPDTKFAVTWFPNEVNLDRNSPDHKREFDRVFVEVSTKF